ncbi:MAG: hypothetical protein NC225_07750 [Clostridium sp.]|nr:hypothetical protein [Clostridium sp.]MCM1460603.1 hypothetical protein [Bacteroides sp.]
MAKEKWIKAFEPMNSAKLIQAAIETANWINKYEHVTEYGNYWDLLPEKEIPQGGLLLSETSLYSGAAGISFFFLRLYLSTKDEKWLTEAKAGIDYVIHEYKGVHAFRNEDNTLTGFDVGHLNGPTGGAYVAELLYEITNEEKYRQHFITVTEDLIASANVDESGLTWYGQYGIIAEGGLVLYLVYAYEILKKEEYIEAARLAGNYIASKAEAAPQGGKRWFAMDTTTFPTLGGGKGYFPGFFYGTAGSAYILACIYEYTQEKEFLELAKEGAEYILNVADVSEDGQAALVRYNDPLAEDLYYLGMCQGPIGTSRLFYKLYTLTENKNYKDFVIKLTEGILAAGAPGRHSSGYWHTYCYCCGAAGMLEHFLSIYGMTGNKRYLDAAYETAEVLIGDAYVHQKLRRWYTSWNRHEPETSDAYIGLYHGSAGCAASLLVLNSVITGNGKLPRFIEDPYEKLF